MGDVKEFLEGEANIGELAEQSQQDLQRVANLVDEAVSNSSSLTSNGRVLMQSDSVIKKIRDKNGFLWQVSIGVTDDGEIGKMSLECQEEIESRPSGFTDDPAKIIEGFVSEIS